MTDDDSKPERDVFFTPAGKFAKGHPGWNKGKQEQDTQPTDLPPFDGDFDDAVIFIAETYKGKPRSFVGLLAVVEDLRRSKPPEFAAYLRAAYANRRQQRDDNIITPGVHVSFTTAPTGMYVNAEGKLEEAADARALWAAKTGHQITDEPPPVSPPSKPPRADDDDDDEGPPYTMAEVNRMTKAEFDAALAAGEIVIVEDDA